MEERHNISVQQESAEAFHALCLNICHPASNINLSFSEETPDTDDGDATLDEAFREEREYVRRRLHEELQREPTEEEVDEWLRQHTEGY
jgi:hypothetical protein